METTDRYLEFANSMRLLRKIAEGGMATVYEAEQIGPHGFAKRVALKVIHPLYAERDEFLQLFIDEAKLSANLVHGNVVQIYQLGEIAGEYFITMEYIPGPTVRSVIDRHTELRQPVPPTVAAYVASRVCRALDFAHNFVAPDGRRLDIVHRDVSPGNVMATWDGHIKLADFGIAKARTSVDPAAKGPMLMGKKHYMSPEQILGLDVQAPSDVFSMAVVLYELLSLEPLFTEEMTMMAIDEVTVRPIPPIRGYVPDIDPVLEKIVHAGLEKDPARRPTAAAMGHALDQWCIGRGEAGSPERLQEHLAQLFPNAYQPPSLGEEATEFSNLRNALGGRKSIFDRLRRAIEGA